MMNFKNIRDAQAYIREMTPEATANIGDQDVWEHEPTREVMVGTTAEQIAETDRENADNYRLLGTVAQILY